MPVSRPDGEGYCGLGISNYAWRTIFENARTVIFEINEHLPRLQGVNGSHRVHLSEADYIVEGVHEPLPLRTYKEPSPVDIQIARNVVAEIPDGAVLGLGVGGVPFTVAKMLAESDRKDLGCWTGSISDAFLAIHKAGKLTNTRKEVDTGYSTWNLAMGSQELYDWLENEPERFYPGDVDHVHAPERMGQLSSFISINGGVQLDLMGQENAESVGSRQLSRHRRSDGLFGGGLPLQGGTGLYLSEFLPAGQGGKSEVQHCSYHPRGQYHFRSSHHDRVCGDRVRGGPSGRPLSGGARRRHGVYCSSGFPGGAGPVCQGQFPLKAFEPVSFGRKKPKRRPRF